MTPTPDALTRVARAICKDRWAYLGMKPCRDAGGCSLCQALARAAINAMENRDE